jgi:O-methyltransferase
MGSPWAGLAAVKFWSRDKFKGTAQLKRKINPTRVPIEAKESIRWLQNLRQSVDRLGQPGARVSEQLWCLHAKHGCFGRKCEIGSRHLSRFFQNESVMAIGQSFKNIYDYKADIDRMETRKRSTYPDIIEEGFWRLYDIGKKYSMIHVPGFYNIYNSIKYVVEHNIPGDFVECGVWLGGASLFAGLAFRHFGQPNRKVHLYDTFYGFPVGSRDVRLGKEVGGPQFDNFRQAVEDNLNREGLTDYIIKEGSVEQTLLQDIPASISVLRLDTDFYPSTKVEMEILYPVLSPRGVLIIDDYGLYQGSRQAFDEYMEKRNMSLLLNRIDNGVRSAIKL